MSMTIDSINGDRAHVKLIMASESMVLSRKPTIEMEIVLLLSGRFCTTIDDHVNGIILQLKMIMVFTIDVSEGD